MQYLNLLDEKQAAGEAQKLLAQIKAKHGKVPNIYRAMANSPQALQALLTFREVLGKGAFSPKEIEAIALAVGEENNCYYCLCAHSALAKAVGFSDNEIKGLRNADIADGKLLALADLAREIVRSKGNPCAGKIQAFLNVGYSNAALIDLVALVSLNIYTNYFNHIFDPEIDFPKV